MKTWKWIVFSLALTLVITGVVSWPLAHWADEGLAYSHYARETAPRYMVPGDTLQLLYHFQLFDGYLWGETPWFHNLYEFNRGDDAATRSITTCYLPFSFFYSLGARWAGVAAGWNFSGFLSIWIGFLCTWLLVRRYTGEWLFSGVAATVTLLSPYRWASFLGGSPAGFGMMWPPVMLLGLDMAIRDRRVLGGIIAGLALFFARWSDLHVFFFMFLLAPVWVVFTPLATGDTWRTLKRDAGRLTLCALAFAFFVGLCVVQVAMFARRVKASSVAGGRPLQDVLLFSANWRELFAWQPGTGHDAVYIGWAALILILLAGIWFVLDARRQPAKAWRPLAIWWVLLTGLGIMVLLALGPNIPRVGPRVWNMLRMLLPPMKLIRQPAKILVVEPAVLAVLLGWALARLGRGMDWKRVVFAVVVVAAMTFDYGRRVNPGVSFLDRQQGAYAAIVADANERGEDARALAVPLWPGDSHWSSIYEYYAGLHRVRMINGYSPGVDPTYRADVFERYASVNQGGLTDAQLDYLLKRHRIAYILLHEDAFPEVVSPFPVQVTLARLLNHPRLEWMGRDKAVWAFRIRATPRQTGEFAAMEQRFFPAWFWTGADLARRQTGPVNVVGRAVVLDTGGAVAADLTALYPASGQRVVLRMSGQGVLRVAMRVVDRESVATNLTAHPAGNWGYIDVPENRDDPELRMGVEGVHGRVRVDFMSVMARNWPLIWDAGQTETMSAATFFHAGYSDSAKGVVTLEPDRVARDVVFYGPRMPLPSGRYRMELFWDADVSPGTSVGLWKIIPEGAEVDVVAGRPTVLEFDWTDERLFAAGFYFYRQAAVTLREVRLMRVR